MNITLAQIDRSPDFPTRQGCREHQEVRFAHGLLYQLHFESVGNTRAEKAIKNKKKWSNDVAAGKPIRAKVSANANGDKLTVMSIN